MSALHDLAAAAGLQVDWEDALGEPQRVADEALVTILGALGVPADSEARIADSRHRLEQDRAAPFLAVDAGAPIALPAGWERAELVLEDGTRRNVAGPLTVAEIGYHRLVDGSRTLRLAVAPPRCFGVGDAAPGRRIWAPAVQVPALRGVRGAAFGDFGTLADAARRFARTGADAVAISPTHALFPADPSRFSPYAPSSRLFHNVLFGDPSLAGAPLPEEPAPGLIDWQAAIPARIAQLRQAWTTAREPVRDAVALFRQKGGEELERHARFDALFAHFFAASGAKGWRDWPAAYHDPAGDAVAAFAAEHADEVSFWAYCQWLARVSLDAAQEAAREGGMAVGLIADLAVGMDGGGSHAWSRRDELLTGLSIGAPPDLLGPDGQSWGITGFSPFALRRTGYDALIATLRAAIGHAGGVRIDHALGLRRLWVVPEGASPKDGAFLTMPLDDMLRIIAIESARAQAIVIGEDLGTVPPGIREAMADRGLLGMRVLPFERGEDGAFVAPAEYEGQAAAMTGTHDLPTMAGWWRGRDIDWTWDLGRTSRSPDKAHDLAARAADRDAFWAAATEAGIATAPEPDADHASEAVDIAVRYVASTPCELAIVPVEDVVGLIEQPNLPGTLDEHPNWRRRLPDTTEALLARPDVAARIALINDARTA